jgi:DNA-binding protein HU-beta
MQKPMTKSQILTHLSEKTFIKKGEIENVLNELCALAYKEAKNTFTIPGLGKLVLVQRKARKGRNPMTGVPINIPAKKVVKFKVSKIAKDVILK